MDTSSANTDSSQHPEINFQSNDDRDSDLNLLSMKNTITPPSLDISQIRNVHSLNEDSDSLKTLPSSDCFKVFVRHRPLSQKERTTSNPSKRLSIVKKEDQIIFLFPPDISNQSSKREKSFVFDDVFDESDKNDSVYNKAVLPSLDNILNGYNCTVFAYGMTGAGKTYTMLGDYRNDEGEPGIVALVVKELFSKFEAEENANYEFSLKFSYIEIYNEQVRDLVGDTNENLMLVEDPTRGVTILNLSEHAIHSYKDVIGLIRQGNLRRKMAANHTNQFSSRSHAIVQIVIQKRDKAKDIVETYTQSKFLLVDLAGSERAAASDNKGIRQQEGANINRSLLALGNCINILSDPNKSGAFVPYRDSKLTRLLKDSLGGNTKAIMIACISPSNLHYEETSNTLKYASSARRIKRQVTRNLKEVEMHVSYYKEIIDSLKNEIESLRKQLNERNMENKLMSALNNSEGVSRAISPEIIQATTASLDELGQKIMANFEEHWEIRQTLNELQGLKKQNDVILEKKKTELLIVAKEVEKDLIHDIETIQLNMSSNDKFLKEMQAALDKNLEERKKMQDKITNLSAKDGFLSGTEENINDSQDGLARLCRILNVEKMELQAENLQIKKEAQSLLEQKQEKDKRISKLEQEVERMKKKLDEKDRKLQQNEGLIKRMKWENEVSPKKTSTSITRSPNAKSSKILGQIARDGRLSPEPSEKPFTKRNVSPALSGSLLGLNKSSKALPGFSNKPYPHMPSFIHFHEELKLSESPKPNRISTQLNTSQQKIQLNLDEYHFAGGINKQKNTPSYSGQLRTPLNVRNTLTSPKSTGDLKFSKQSSNSRNEKRDISSNSSHRNSRTNLKDECDLHSSGKGQLPNNPNKPTERGTQIELKNRLSGTNILSKKHSQPELQKPSQNSKPNAKGFGERPASAKENLKKYNQPIPSKEDRGGEKKLSNVGSIVGSPKNLEDILNSELNPEFYEPLIADSPAKSLKIKQERELASLEQAREIARNFKVRIYSLVYAIENNLMDDNKRKEVNQLLKDYETMKPKISAEDQKILTKLKTAALDRTSTREIGGTANKTGNAIKSLALPGNQEAEISALSELSRQLKGTSSTVDFNRHASRSPTKNHLTLLSVNEARHQLKPRVRMGSIEDSVLSKSIGNISIETELASPKKPKEAVQNVIEKQRKNLQSELQKMKRKS